MKYEAMFMKMNETDLQTLTGGGNLHIVAESGVGVRWSLSIPMPPPIAELPVVRPVKM